jgi:hypothetical protein
MAPTLPQQIVSASGCFTQVLPPRPYRTLGSTVTVEASHDRVVRWSEEALDDGRLVWPNILRSPAIGRDFASVARLSPKDFVLLGVGLPSARLDLSDEPMRPGIEGFMARGDLLPDGGDALGFEILDLDDDVFSHSWLCNSLERDAGERFNVRPNEHGLIDTYEEADRVCAWVNEEAELGRTSAAGPTWDPWVLVRYPLT